MAVRLYKSIYVEEGFEDKIDAAIVKLMNTKLGQDADLDMDGDWDVISEGDEQDYDE